MGFFHHVRSLCPVVAGPWWPCRQYVYQQMRKLNVMPGDIICRRGNAFMYGAVPFSDFICWVTASQYSHAALVIDTKDDILLADVNTTGLRRQYITDWTDDIRGDNILVMRYNGDPALRRVAAENARHVLNLDPAVDDEFLDDNDGRNFYCVELVCWCYMRAGVMLCEDVPICRLPRWRKWFNLICKMHGVSPNNPVWCVGNKDVGLLSSPHLEVVGTIPYSPVHKLRHRPSHPNMFAGA